MITGEPITRHDIRLYRSRMRRHDLLVVGVYSIGAWITITAIVYFFVLADTANYFTKILAAMLMIVMISAYIEVLEKHLFPRKVAP